MWISKGLIFIVRCDSYKKYFKKGKEKKGGGFRFWILINVFC